MSTQPDNTLATVARHASSAPGDKSTGMIDMDSQDSKYVECWLKLEKIARDGFYLRYRDYYTMTSHQLRTVAKDANKAAKKMAKKARKSHSQPSSVGEIRLEAAGARENSDEATIMSFFTRSSWTAINAQLEKEVKEEKEEAWQYKSKAKPKPKPLTKLIRKLIESHNLPDFDYMQMVINLYATRNDTAHQNLGALARIGHSFPLSLIIGEDLETLGRLDHFWFRKQHTIPVEHINTTKDAVLKTASLFFKEFVYFEGFGEIKCTTAWPQNPDGTFNRSGHSTGEITEIVDAYYEMGNNCYEYLTGGVRRVFRPA